MAALSSIDVRRKEDAQRLLEQLESVDAILVGAAAVTMPSIPTRNTLTG